MLCKYKAAASALARLTPFRKLLTLHHSPWLTICPALAMSPNLVQPDFPPPHLPNEILLEIISILQSNRDDISHGTLCSFLRLSRTCYSMAFQALYQCPYLTIDNLNHFKKSLVESGYGSMVKRLHLPSLRTDHQTRDAVSIILECKDGLEEFITTGTYSSWMDGCLIPLSRCVNLKNLDFSSLGVWMSTISSFLAIVSQFQKLKTFYMPSTFLPPPQITDVKPPLHWPPRLTELYMSGQSTPGYLQGLSAQLQPFLRVVKLTDRLHVSEVLDMINITGCQLQTLEIDAWVANFCRRNLDRLLHALPVIRRLDIHICTGYVIAEFYGPCMLADEAISTLRDLALECPQGCPTPRHVNWIDGGKVVFLGSMWSRLSKLDVLRDRIYFSKRHKPLWNDRVCPCHIRELHAPKPTVFKSGLELEGIDSGIQDLFLEHESEDPASG